MAIPGEHDEFNTVGSVHLAPVSERNDAAQPAAVLVENADALAARVELAVQRQVGAIPENGQTVVSVERRLQQADEHDEHERDE